jgi:hypothetical protein
MKVVVATWLSILYLVGGPAAQAQSPAVTSGIQLAGEVTALDGQSKQITVRSEKGETVTFSVAERVPLRRVPPGAKDLTGAVRIALTDIGVGDRVVARVQKSEDQKFTANSVIVMARSDFAQQRQREQDEWQKRGTSGVVTAVDVAGKTFAIKAPQKTITIQTGDNTDYRRYAPDSVKFSAAQASSFAAIRTGDQVRVLGDKNGDGASIKAERVVSGAFRQIAGTIAAIDPKASEIVIRDLATKELLTVRVIGDSTMKKLPAQVATTLARRYQPAGRADGVSGNGSGGADIGQTLDRLPPMPFPELKPGDAIMLSSTSGAAPGRVTAIMLLAGVEALLTASPDAPRDIMGGWNLNGGGEQ